jgi:predicted ABC-type sugar transport system permease subunit
METEATQIQKRSFWQSDATQKLAAFGGLIVLFVVFSLASPNFMQFSNYC